MLPLELLLTSQSNANSFGNLKMYSENFTAAFMRPHGNSTENAKAHSSWLKANLPNVRKHSTLSSILFTEF